MQPLPVSKSKLNNVGLPEEVGLPVMREAERRRAWLASLLMQRETPALRRLAFTFERLRRAPRPWRRRLQRQLAATLTGAAMLLALTSAPAGAETTATINVFSGEVNIAANGRCSLREAIINANNGAQTHADCAAGSAGADTINLPGGSTFLIQNGHATVYGSLTGLPTITGNITIDGHGSTIRREATTKFRLMAVSDGGDLTLNDTRLTNGHTTDDGGAIYLYGANLGLYNSTVTGNKADGDGGGISTGHYPDGGADIHLDYTSVQGNSAADGGAIHADYSSVHIHYSQLSGNSATLNGGAIFTFESSIAIDLSTLDNNEAAFRGGAIDMDGSVWLDLVNSTVSGNVAGNSGGGISLVGYPYGGNAEIVNSTITENQAAQNGGGIDSYYAQLTLARSMVTGNSAGGAGREIYHDTTNYYYVFANSHNLFGHSGNSGVAGFTPGATDIVPTVKLLAIRDSALGNNGGSTITHALVSGSPALDAAPNAACNAGPVFGYDQRQLPRNQNGKGGVTANECDIGAFEAQGVPPPPAKLYVAPTAAGNVSGIAATPQDILAFDLATETWAMHFDGSDLGITKALAAFSQMPNDDDLLLSFRVNVTLPGVGAVTPWDVVRFVPTSLGNTTAGSFQWYIDGSDVGLTAASEKIDTLDALPDGRVLVSTGGALSAPKQGGGTLKSQDEDLSALHATSFGANTVGAWSIYFNPTAIPGVKAEDVAGAAVDSNSGVVFVTFDSAFNVDGVSGDAKDVVRFAPVYGGWKIWRVWRGPNNGFNLNLAGIERQ